MFNSSTHIDRDTFKVYRILYRDAVYLIDTPTAEMNLMNY